jgi:hypothetical protein
VILNIRGRIMTNNNNQMDIKEKTISRLLKKGKLRGRIDAKCCECIYDPIGDGTWRFQVEICTSFMCPLYPVRPTTIKVKEATKKEAATSQIL